MIQKEAPGLFNKISVSTEREHRNREPMKL